MRPLRLLTTLALLALAFAGPALAAEAKCPLDLDACLQRYRRTRARPWFGVSVERDTLRRLVVKSVESGGPSDRAGIQAGDVIERIEGKSPTEWFADKAGWKPGDTGNIALLRQDRPATLKLRFEAIPDEIFAHMIGVHMVEAHLAHMRDSERAATGDR